MLPTCRLSSLVVLPALLLCATALPAQVQQVVPADRADLEAFTTSTYPWSFSEVRWQQIVDVGAVATSGGVLSRLSWRRDGSNLTTFTAKTWNYTVTLSQTPVSPAAMTTTWASNRGPAAGTVVHSGALNLPASSPSYPTPAPFELHVPFSSPFPFTVAAGDLLIEVEGADPGNQSVSWASDAETLWSTARGDATNVTPPSGGGCVGPANEQIAISVAGTQAVVGGTMTLTTRVLGTYTAFLNWIGLGNQSWGAIPLPFDLTPIGATNCVIGADILVSQAGTTLTFTWPIPNDPVLEGGIVFMQAAGLVPGANPAGLLTTNTLQIRVGGPTPLPALFQSVWRRSDLGNPIGFMSGAGYFGTVIRFEGAFN